MDERRERSGRATGDRPTGLAGSRAAILEIFGITSRQFGLIRWSFAYAECQCKLWSFKWCDNMVIQVIATVIVRCAKEYIGHIPQGRKGHPGAERSKATRRVTCCVVRSRCTFERRSRDFRTSTRVKVSAGYRLSCEEPRHNPSRASGCVRPRVYGVTSRALRDADIDRDSDATFKSDHSRANKSRALLGRAESGGDNPSDAGGVWINLTGDRLISDRTTFQWSARIVVPRRNSYIASHGDAATRHVGQGATRGFNDRWVSIRTITRVPSFDVDESAGGAIRQPGILRGGRNESGDRYRRPSEAGNKSVERPVLVELIGDCNRMSCRQSSFATIRPTQRGMLRREESRGASNYI